MASFGGDQKGQGDKWAQVVYPQMVAIITTACKAAQVNVEQRRNTFELYGADFVLDSAYRPWLLEVNSSPSMCRNTPTCGRSASFLYSSFSHSNLTRL